jgi:archaeosine synthase beta-subunit
VNQPAEALSRNAVVDRVTSRAWRDQQFRDLLFSRPVEALVQEFGYVPPGFERVSFQPREVDRLRLRQTPGGQSLLVRPKRGDRPLSVVTRQVFGQRELVVVFYTKRCQYQCTFCTLPATSAFSDVNGESIRAQLAAAFETAGSELGKLQQISLGNEGSILDERTFSEEQLDWVLSSCVALPSVRSLVLETRGEFVSEACLDRIIERIAPCKLTLKIGLESADERVREEILRKRMDLESFERTVVTMGRKGVALASYVLLKADPAHSDEEGKADALRTCVYLKELCRRAGTELTLRLNSMYCAEGSLWARWAEEQGWTPPSIFDLADVMIAAREDTVPVFAGLYDEGLSTRTGHYEARPDFQRWALDALERYNQTMDLSLLERVAAGRPSNP